MRKEKEKSEGCKAAENRRGGWDSPDVPEQEGCSAAPGSNDCDDVFPYIVKASYISFYNWQMCLHTAHNPFILCNPFLKLIIFLCISLSPCRK